MKGCKFSTILFGCFLVNSFITLPKSLVVGPSQKLIRQYSTYFLRFVFLLIFNFNVFVFSIHYEIRLMIYAIKVQKIHNANILISIEK